MRNLLILLLFLRLPFNIVAQDTISGIRGSTNSKQTDENSGLFKINNSEAGTLSTRISFYGGGGYLFKPLNSIVSFDFPPYIKKLQIGYVYGAEIIVYPKDVIGLGLMYSIFHDNYSLPAMHDEDNFSATYFGAVLSLKQQAGWKPLKFIYCFSLGYLSNSNTGSQSGAPWNADGSSIGGSAEAGFDLKVTKNMAIGVNLSIVGGSIKSYDLNGATIILSRPDNLLRADLTGGLRFYF
jgi:hypothetical protein